MKKIKIKKGEMEEAEKILKPDEEIIFEKILKLQYNENKKRKTGQFLIRFPKEFEELLGLEKEKKVKFIVTVPPPHTKKQVNIEMEIMK